MTARHRRVSAATRDKFRNAAATLEQARDLAARRKPVCEWYVGCGRPAVGTTPHPVSGILHVCAPCATMFELPVTA